MMMLSGKASVPMWENRERETNAKRVALGSAALEAVAHRFTMDVGYFHFKKSTNDSKETTQNPKF